MLPGYSLVDSVVVMVTGKSGTCSMKASDLSNMFTFKMTLLEDDAGESIGPTDFSRETYQQLVEIVTTSLDWVLNLSIASGE